LPQEIPAGIDLTTLLGVKAAKETANGAMGMEVMLPALKSGLQDILGKNPGIVCSVGNVMYLDFDNRIVIIKPYRSIVVRTQEEKIFFKSSLFTWSEYKAPSATSLQTFLKKNPSVEGVLAILVGLRTNELAFTHLNDETIKQQKNDAL